MLSKAKRLNIRKSFSWLRSGTRVETEHLGILYKYSPDHKPKLAVRILKTNFKKSTTRNKIRRLVFKGIELVYDKLKTGVCIIITVKPNILYLDNGNIPQAVVEILNQAKLLNDENNRN